MSAANEERNRRMLRARDAIDRRYREPLDVRSLAQIAYISEAHFIRTFKAVFGETPHRYLQRRRVERAMFLLREGDLPVVDVCTEVGFTSRGTFVRTFTAVVGTSPTAYRAARADFRRVPSCFVARWTRPSSFSSFGDAREVAHALA